MLALIIITAILVLCLVLSIIFNWETIVITSILFLIFIGLVGWFGIGMNATSKIKYEIVPKNNFEVIISEKYSKIILLNDNINETFNDAKTYNIVNKEEDNYYIEKKEYNIYNRLINVSYIITDTITNQEILKQTLNNTY